MDLNRAKNLLSAMQPQLEQFENLDEIDFDFSNEDERFEASQLRMIATDLDKALGRLKYLKKPILAEGRLSKRSDGRYEIVDTDYYFTSGSTVEVWDDEDEYYFKTTIEHTNDDYYAVNMSSKALEGMKVRVR